jgi:hypothetical protein
MILRQYGADVLKMRVREGITGRAMNNVGTVVELTFEGDDRVFFVVTDVQTMAEEDQAAAAYLESYDGPGMPVRLDLRLTMAMFKDGAPIDQFLAHLREQAERH